jgi:small subunit ribosomal protein S20
MANHKSAEKRIRSNDAKRERNRYVAKTTRNLLKELRSTTEKSKATSLIPKLSSMLDRLAKNNVIHKNKAANLKSSIQLHVSKLA